MRGYIYRTLKHNYIGTEHLLLALLHEKEGRGAQVLGNLGMKLDDVRQDVIKFVGCETKA
ncbi:MAG: Clp protease N-terminal domain-containing protein [Planctomycetota bacterium]